MEQLVQLNSGAKLSPNLALPSEAALSNLSELNCVRLSPHFTLGELTKSNSHPEIYNIPSHEAIANLKRVCVWLEELRKRYNEFIHPAPNPAPHMGGEYTAQSTPLLMGGEHTIPSTPLLMGGGVGGGGDKARLQPIIINSGYRSPQLNRAIGGVPSSNHLTGCAVDIRVTGMEQLIVYAAILIQYANETKQDFDELLIEKNKHGAIWLHFAIRPNSNRRKVSFLSTK